MTTPDIINGIFELGAAPLIFLSINNLIKAKKVRGVNKYHIGFFTLWGFWNLFYYPHLGQWCSFVGGLSIVVTNSVWLGLITYYIQKERHDKNSVS